MPQLRAGANAYFIVGGGKHCDFRYTARAHLDELLFRTNPVECLSTARSSVRCVANSGYSLLKFCSSSRILHASISSSVMPAVYNRRFPVSVTFAINSDAGWSFRTTTDTVRPSDQCGQPERRNTSSSASVTRPDRAAATSPAVMPMSLSM